MTETKANKVSGLVCKVCDSEDIELDIVIVDRQRYRCGDCNALFFNDEITTVDNKKDPPDKETKIIEAYKNGMLVNDICKRFKLSSHVAFYNILHEHKIPLRSKDPSHPASSLKTRAEALKEIKTYKCKKCDFTTTELPKLVGHYGSVHSYHHEKKEGEEKATEQDQEEPKPKKETHMPLGRPKTGVALNCIDCGKELYIRKSRVVEDPTAEHRCRECAKKHFKPPAKQKKKKSESVSSQEEKETTEEKKETELPQRKLGFNWAQSRRLKEQKDEIIEYAKTHTRDEVCEKFNMGKSTLAKKQKDWGFDCKLANRRATRGQEDIVRSKISTVSRNNLTPTERDELLYLRGYYDGSMNKNGKKKKK